MKKFILSLFLTFTLVSPVLADFESGVIQFEQGDFEGALKTLTPLAEDGDPRAQYVVGVIWLNGMVGEPRPDEAAGWLKRAAEQDYVEAQMELARLFKTGEGVPTDLGQMVTWYRRAAQQGHVGAQLFVADAYAYGQGVGPDLVQAYMWYEIAMRYWGDLAVHARDAIAEKMTREQIDEARRLASAVKLPSAQ